MSDVTVTESRDILNEGSRTFEERAVELKAISKKEEEALKRKKNSSFRNFLQVNRDTYKLEDKLMKENPLAYRIWRFLANHMDHYNAVMVSYVALTEVFEVSRTTIYRAIKVLEDNDYIRIYKSGTSNVYTLNDEMVWSSWGSNRPLSKFQANIIISESEQSDKVKSEIKLKIERHKEIKTK